MSSAQGDSSAVAACACVGIPESLIKRQQERNDRLLKKKEANIDGQANQASLQLFNQQFRQKQLEIERGLKEAAKCKVSDRGDVFHRISGDLNLLHRHLASASSLLTPYDLRVLKETLSGLERQIAQDQTSLIPKKKFAFKKRQDKILACDNPLKQCKEEMVKDVVDSFHVTGPGFHNRENETLYLREEDVKGREVTLSDLRGCTVVIKGPVATSVLLYGATECTVVAWCHQMRIHDSTDSDFYIRVATDPIVENCRRVRFAPYTYTYPDMNIDEETSGLDPSTDRWDNVQDFDWLVLSHRSPYWSIIPADLRRTHWPD